ncbi:MAG TPA: GrpB family protein [Streptosporangiaceae bacterium]|jgi:GrpB-like predicted nucleotidyltransferase (UPF0157 family)
MSDQQITVHAYDATWPDRFADQQAIVTPLLEPWLAGPIEHIGSTSVPGLRAKPVIDMLAPVRSLAAAQAVIPVLRRAGWWDWPDDPNSSYRLWFLRPSPQARTHHLHMIERDDVHARALLMFRDALRADAALRQNYADLKDRLAVEHPDNRNAYTNAKGDFVAQVLRGAGADVPSRGLLPE